MVLIKLAPSILLSLYLFVTVFLAAYGISAQITYGCLLPNNPIMLTNPTGYCSRCGNSFYSPASIPWSTLEQHLRQYPVNNSIYDVSSNVCELVEVRFYMFVKNPDALPPIFYFSEKFLFTGGYQVVYGSNIIGYASCPGNNSIVRVGFSNVLLETISGFSSVPNAAGSVIHKH